MLVPDNIEKIHWIVVKATCLGDNLQILTYSSQQRLGKTSDITGTLIFINGYNICSSNSIQHHTGFAIYDQNKKYKNPKSDVY